MQLKPANRYTIHTYREKCADVSVADIQMVIIQASGFSIVDLEPFADACSKKALIKLGSVIKLVFLSKS